ncbi:MAG TPA: DUF6438 domain-containing protein [Gemmatimonadales bacterium]|nr:DUF6438 domain-containing protein [Gemmatimonadales bacterium]
MKASLPGSTLVFITIACASRPAAPPSAEGTPTVSAAAAGQVVTLYRSPCYGGCPVYSLSVTADGLVSYEGSAGVRHRGSATARMPAARVSALLAELEAAGYFGFANRYRPSEPVCGRYVPDAPTVITSARLGTRIKRIEHDYGCGAAPMALRVLESRIDVVLGSGRWTGR